MGIMLESPVEVDELLMHEGVHCDLPIKGCLLLYRWQVTIQQQVGAVQEVSLLSQVLYVIPEKKDSSGLIVKHSMLIRLSVSSLIRIGSPSVQKDALLPINKSDTGIARACSKL